jgi:hypothetical protein
MNAIISSKKFKKGGSDKLIGAGAQTPITLHSRLGDAQPETIKYKNGLQKNDDILGLSHLRTTD